ncbi:hypothetical protein DL89DRAFT_266140 [Linderina pennispora]|uniref:Uncharacterized protein n=1 Tax=Linderina pennispora TaxID=61395 RepID=A0A1Y1WC57_9FUNG|nr:uncharacterized protein DL89DRAFT_266140 [Linderina pennispora]ORX71121.1 hypothetical protein DL89DRAFT_266140 [Linderina pennispora]
MVLAVAVAVAVGGVAVGQYWAVLGIIWAYSGRQTVRCSGERVQKDYCAKRSEEEMPG